MDEPRISVQTETESPKIIRLYLEQREKMSEHERMILLIAIKVGTTNLVLTETEAGLNF